MENLFIEKTHQSPEVRFQKDGNLLIKGISNGSNVQKFFEPVIAWLHEFKTQSPSKVNLILEIYYLNTSSALVMVEILKLVNSYKENGSHLTITWLYEEDDDDILDLGEDIQISTKSEFEFMMIK